MARTFGNYSPVVELWTTWEESITLEDEAGDAVDLTGYAVRAQLREELPVLDPDTSVPTTDPLLELTTAGYYAVAPDWPVYAGFSVPSPLTGVVLLAVPPNEFSAEVSPTGAQTKLYWDVRLVDSGTGYTIPVVKGKVQFKQATTV